MKVKKLKIALVLPITISMAISIGVLLVFCKPTAQVELPINVSSQSFSDSKIRYEMSDAKRLPKNEIVNSQRSEEPSPEKGLPKLTIFIGDSRMVGMDNAVDDDSIYIAKVGEGYNWYKEYAEEILEKTIESNSDKSLSVIFNLGVNDLEDAQKYVAAVNELSAKYSNVRFSYMSVNPVGVTTITNEQIKIFNNTLQTMLDNKVNYIDTYTYLMAKGYNTVDGLHYTDETYRVIHDYVKSS